MIRATKFGLVAVAMTASMFSIAGPAEAAPTFKNCDAMHRKFEHGVAKSRAAANRQVRQGNDRPAVKPKVYNANKKSDRDKDGTACETS